MCKALKNQNSYHLTLIPVNVFPAKCQSVARRNQAAPKDREGDFLKHLLQKTELEVVAMTPGAIVFIFMPVT